MSSLAKKISDTRWLIGIICVFVSMAVFYATYLLPLAFEGAPKPIVDNAYEEGLVYQKVIDSEQRAKDMGYQLEILPVDFATNHPVLTIELLDAKGDALSGRDVMVRGVYPAEEKLDFVEEKASETVEGVYQLLVPKLKSGLWLINVKIIEAEEPHSLLRVKNIF